MRIVRSLLAPLACLPRPPRWRPAPSTNLGNFGSHRRAAAAAGRGAAGRGRSAPAQVRVALILPLSAHGNAGVAAQSMKNAAEMALAEFKNPNIQLLVKDDGGNAAGAQPPRSRRSARAPRSSSGRCSRSRSARSAQVARQRGIPVIAFSTDASVAARGVYLLSFLPESDVRRIVEYAVSRGKRSFARAAAGQRLWHGGARPRSSRRSRAAAAASSRWRNIRSIRARMAEPAQRVAQVANAGRQRSSFPTAPTRCRRWCARWRPPSVNLKRVQLLGTGLWDDPRIFSDQRLQGGWYAAPDAGRLPQFRGALSRALRAGSGAHRDARL